MKTRCNLQICTLLPSIEQGGAVRAPEEVFSLAVPFNSLQAVSPSVLCRGLEEYSHLVMLGLQNNRLSRLECKVGQHD